MLDHPCVVLLRVLSVLLFVGVGAAMAQPCAEVVDDQHIRFEGHVYRTVDDEGVYYVDPDEHVGVPLPETVVPLGERLGEGRCVKPVRLRLVDYVNCSQTSHQFSEIGGARASRLLNIHNRTYRVTAAPSGFQLNYFSYRVATDPWPGRAHLIVVESSDDRERYTSVALTHPRAGAWAPPFEGEPLCPTGAHWNNCFSFCQEPDCFHPDVGVTAYTGLEFPLTQRPKYIRALFYPKMAEMKVTISSSGWYRTFHSTSGASASRIWVYAFEDEVTDRMPDLDLPQGPQRRVGIYKTHPWYFYAHHGVPVRTRQQREMALDIMLDTLAFCGFNWLEFNAINGSDRAGAAWYDSAWFHNNGGNLLSELPPLAQAKGIDLVPVITSLTIPDPPRTALGVTFSENSFQRLGAGSFTQAFSNRAPDPMRPEVQEWLGKFIDEIAVRVVDQPAVKGIGFRVNGKIGLCYQSNQDGLYGAKESGYSAWNVQQYKDATGSEVPTQLGRSYGWLKSRPDEWERWIDFRCQRMRDFWLAMRDRVRSHRSDLTLYVKIVLPSEVPGTNIEWPTLGYSALELLRHHGYDPALYHGEEGIVVERTMMVDEDRFFFSGRWGYPAGANDWAYKAFHYQPVLPWEIFTGSGRAVELYHNYWEESFHPDNEFGPDLRTHTATAPGRGFYEPVTFSLRHADVDTISFMGWERPILSHEHDLRAFSAAYRALPNRPFAPFEGEVQHGGDDVVVRRYDDRLALLNDSGNVRTVTLVFPTPLPDGMALRDAAYGHIYLAHGLQPRQSLTLTLEPWSLTTLIPLYDGPAPTATPMGPTPTPTATYTPSPTPTREAFLLNAGFEQDGRAGVFPPRHWGGWGEPYPDGTVNEQMHGSTAVFQKYEGNHGAGITLSGQSVTGGGLFQIVPVTPGVRYQASAMAFTPRMNSGSGPAGQVRLGLDPNGGYDPDAAGIHWTDWQSFPGAWSAIGHSGEQSVSATGEEMTLFLAYRQPVAMLWNGMYFDAVRFEEARGLATLMLD